MTKLITLAIVYLFFTFSNRLTERQGRHALAVQEKIRNPAETLRLQDLGALYQYDQLYTGTWRREGGVSDLGLTEEQGQLQMSVSRVSGSRQQKLSILLSLSNGQYIDDGVIDLNIVLETNKL